MFGLKFCMRHTWVYPPYNEWTHYWLIDGNSYWYEYSEGTKICSHCGRKKWFRHTLPHFPYNDGSKTVYMRKLSIWIK